MGGELARPSRRWSLRLKAPATGRERGFPKFFNLPELEPVPRGRDIKTSDQLSLPTPEVTYHNEVSQPTEIQRICAGALRARTKVHARMVDPSEDNMLAITNDGRKLGLDQRVVNPLLPDADGTKVNRLWTTCSASGRTGRERS